MKTVISKEAAIEMIDATIRGTMAMTLDISSPMDKAMRKTGNPFYGKGMVKLVSINGMVGTDYQAGLDRLANKEGKDEREAKPRQWGVLSANRIWVTHKGKTYIQVGSVKNASQPVYMLAGEVVDTEAVKPFIPEKTKSSSQTDLDGEIVVRDIDMENVLAMRFNGADYAIVKTPVVAQEVEVDAKETIDA